MSRFLHIRNPDPDWPGESVESFVQRLGQPACILLDGEDNTRTRVVVTLQHGNEPSGVRAVYRWLRSGRRPRVRTVCLLPSIEAAVAAPVFSHRVLPGLRDLNRCFRAPFDDSQGELAAEILGILNAHRPEAVVDIHNTSGSGPGFGVAISVDRKHVALVSLFTHRLVTNDLRLGALMEIAEHLYPTVTIECGGRLDAAADELGWQGLEAFLTRADVLTPRSADFGLEIFPNPTRLEVVADCSLVYGDYPHDGFDLTLKSDIERYNFGMVEAGTLLGWVGKRDLSIFFSRNLQQGHVPGDLVQARDGGLYTSRDLKLFMITSNPLIAKMDCLFYAARAGDEPVLKP